MVNGEEKTLGRLKETPGHGRDVSNWCSTCSTCASRKDPTPRPRAELQTISPGYPLQIVAVDILGPLQQSENGNSYVLMAGDYFTRWMEAYAIPNQEASTVANKLVDEMFCQFSLPEQLHSDHGQQFESNLIKEMSKTLDIQKTRITPYHPQSDGLIERYTRSLLSMLSTTVQDHPWDREKCLHKVC